MISTVSGNPGGRFMCGGEGQRKLHALENTAGQGEVAVNKSRPSSDQGLIEMNEKLNIHFHA